jgi:hypothetical protein
VLPANLYQNPGGEYKISVKSQFGTNAGRLLKDVRTVEFDRILTAA